MNFKYAFPAIKGIQANSEYYVCMVPITILSKIFSDDYNMIEPEYRAQRKVNYQRIPKMENYILSNRNSYVFTSLAASIDGDYQFIEKEKDLGMLEIDLTSTFLLNDGQHRNQALQAALAEDKSLQNESISIVFFADKGLKRSQQIFTDLNKHAVNPSKSLATLFDSKDPESILAKEILKTNKFLKTYTDLERDNLGKNSAKLFTLSNIVKANKRMFQNTKLSEKQKFEYAKFFWQLVSENIEEWNLLEKKQITKKSLREDYLVTQGVILEALGKLGNFFIQENYTKADICKYMVNLKNVNWMRSNPDWNGRALDRGKIRRGNREITLTYIKIKELIGIELFDKEKIQAKQLGDNNG